MTNNTAGGKLLIATPKITNSVFNKSVVYIHTDDDTGSIGVMLNKRMDYDMAVAWGKQIGWEHPNAVFQGGPVERQLGYVIHSTDYARDTSVQLNSVLSYTGGRYIVDDINRGIGPNQFVLLTGYCQWQPYQLDTELALGWWTLADFDEEFFFQGLDRDAGWEHAINVAAENKAASILDMAY